jgi:flagellar hook assembly protein FlgD
MHWQGPALDPAYPNPYLGGKLTVPYIISQAGPADLRILDLRGQLVKTLVQDGNHAVGRYWAAWDGRNDEGAQVSSGLYFLILKTSGEKLFRRFVVVR